MKISEVIKSLSASNAAIKNTASSEPKEGWYPAYSASGQDVWLPDCRFTQKGIVVSAVGARCGKAFKADGKWNICANTHPLSVDETKALRDYCWYMINNEDWWIKGGTAQPFVKVKDSFNRDFNFPPISEQKMIVSRLDTIQALINQKQLQIKRLDELVKARFVEMFSCDKSNIRKLSELTETITKGTTPTTAGFSFEDDGINFFKIESITDDHRVNLQKVAHVNEECHSTFKRSQLKEGDVLFSIAGAIGRTAIIHDKDLPGNTNQALAIIRLKANSNVSRKYLISALESPEVVEQYRKKKRGVAQMNLSLKDIGNISIPVPNSTKQSEFEKFAKQVDKSKFVLSNKLTMCDFYIRLIHDRVMHGRINLRVT